jgi:hypothetical protein
MIAILSIGIARGSDAPLTVSGLQFPIGLADGGFSFEVMPDGTAEFTSRGGKVSRRQLTPEEHGALVRLVVDTGVLEVKGEFGSCQIEGLIRSLKVTMGAAKTGITLCDWEAETKSVRARARKAHAVWVAVRRLFPDNYSGNDRQVDERQLKSDAAER